MLVHPNMKICRHLLPLMLFQTSMTLFCETQRYFFVHTMEVNRLHCCLIHSVLQNSLCSAEKINSYRFGTVIRVNK